MINLMDQPSLAKGGPPQVEVPSVSWSLTLIYPYQKGAYGYCQK